MYQLHIQTSKFGTMAGYCNH